MIFLFHILMCLRFDSSKPNTENPNCLNFSASSDKLHVSGSTSID